MRRFSTDAGEMRSEDRPCQPAGAITLRLVCPEDSDFLYEVYASTRQHKLDALGWAGAQREIFLKMQFAARRRSYLAQFPAGDFPIVLYHHRPIGRLYIEYRVDEIRGIDITLLPIYRQTGIGTAILQDLLAEATRVGKPFRIHVEKLSRARRLYERLGFTVLADDGVHLSME